MENIKNIIIYYPSFERGGVEKIIQNLIFFFIKKKIKIYLITTNKKNLGPIKKFKNLSIIYGKTSAFLGKLIRALILILLKSLRTILLVYFLFG